jgi:hypothetical protein
MREAETIPNFQTQNLSPQLAITEPTIGLTSHPPASTIIIANNVSKMFNPTAKSSKKSNTGL